MATYRQDITYYEDGYGDVTINIIIADSYDNIFAASSLSTDIIEFSDIDFKNEAAIGQLSTDQANFEIDESTFSYDDDVVIDATDTQQDIDNEVLTLCKNSTQASPSYIGVFLNTASTADIDDSLFIGAIDYDYEQEDLGWSGTEFSTTASPVAKYKFTTTPAQEALFDAISLQTVIDNCTTNLINNAFDGDGFYANSSAFGDYATKIPYLIKLKTLLEIIKDQYITELSNAGYGTFTIEFDTCELDGDWYPARWNLAQTTDFKGPFVDFISCVIYGATVSKENSGEYVEYKDSDAKSLIFTGGVDLINDDYDYLYISLSNVIDPEEFGESYRMEVYPEAATKSRWQNNPRVDDSFTNLLYALATDLNLHFLLEFSSQTEITVKFLPKSTMGGNTLYIKDVSKSSSKRFALEERNNSKYINGVNSYLSVENDKPIPNQARPVHRAEATEVYNELSGEKSLIGIGAQTWRVLDTLKGKDDVPGVYPTFEMKGITIPYYLIMTKSGNPVNLTQWNSVSLSKQLFMKVDKLAGETNAPASYYTPIIRHSISYDGEDYEFNTLEDLRDNVNVYAKRNYGKELSLTIPFFMAFSTSSSGTSPSIKNLGLNDKVVYDTVEYVITAYNINLQDKQVELSLENTGRFDYSNVISISDGKKINNSVQSADEEDEETITFAYTADGAISEGEFVSLKTATTVERSEASNTHYNRLLGVALNDAADTEGVSVQVSGKVSISWLSGSVNDAVYIRDISSTENLSTTALTGVSGSEDLLAQVGTITDTNEMRINIKEHFVLT